MAPDSVSPDDWTERCMVRTCLHQGTLRIVTPSMVSTPQHQARTLALLGDTVRTVAAYIVKRAKPVILAQDEEEREGCDVEGDVVACLCEAAAVRDVQPLLAEDGATLEVEDRGRSPPILWEDFLLDKGLSVRLGGHVRVLGALAVNLQVRCEDGDAKEDQRRL